MNDETVLSTETIENVPVESTSPPTEAITGESETLVVVDYTPVIMDATSSLANIFLCGALMIVGVLCAFKFWEVKLR